MEIHFRLFPPCKLIMTLSGYRTVAARRYNNFRFVNHENGFSFWFSVKDGKNKFTLQLLRLRRLLLLQDSYRDTASSQLEGVGRDRELNV